jgi:hypothetical protein
VNFWINSSTGVLAVCEQFRPVFDPQGNMIRGKRNGSFVIDPKGIDIQHEVIPGQVELPEDHQSVRDRIRRGSSAGGSSPNK